MGGGCAPAHPSGGGRARGRGDGGGLPLERPLRDHHAPDLQRLPRRGVHRLRPPALLAERRPGPRRGARHPDRDELRQRLRGRGAGDRRAPGGSGPARGGQAGHGARGQDRGAHRLRRGRPGGPRAGGPGHLVVHPARHSCAASPGGPTPEGRGRTGISASASSSCSSSSGSWPRRVRPTSSTPRSSSRWPVTSSRTATTGGSCCGPACRSGLLAAALLQANNLRDIATDTESGKKTLAVRLGRRRAGLLYCYTLMGVALSIGVLYSYRPWALLALLAHASGRWPGPPCAERQRGTGAPPHARHDRPPADPHRRAPHDRAAAVRPAR